MSTTGVRSNDASAIGRGQRRLAGPVVEMARACFSGRLVLKWSERVLGSQSTDSKASYRAQHVHLGPAFGREAAHPRWQPCNAPRAVRSRVYPERGANVGPHLRTREMSGVWSRRRDLLTG